MTTSTTPASPAAGAPPPTPTVPPGPRYVFAIFGTDQADRIGELVRGTYPPDDRYELPTGDWLVADLIKQTSKVYEKLVGQSESDQQISVIVAKVERVYGLHDVAVWDWIDSKKNGEP